MSFYNEKNDSYLQVVEYKDYLLLLKNGMIYWCNGDFKNEPELLMVYEPWGERINIIKFLPFDCSWGFELTSLLEHGIVTVVRIKEMKAEDGAQKLIVDGAPVEIGISIGKGVKAKAVNILNYGTG